MRRVAATLAVIAAALAAATGASAGRPLESCALLVHAAKPEVVAVAVHWPHVGWLILVFSNGRLVGAQPSKQDPCAGSDPTAA